MGTLVSALVERASIASVLNCTRDEATRRLGDAATGFLETQEVLPGYKSICVTRSKHISYGQLQEFFRSLQAQWIVDNVGVPFPASEQAIEIAQGARSDRYYKQLEKEWRAILALCRLWNEHALPMSVGCAIGIAATQASHGYALGSIRNGRSTIRFAHYFSGLPVPTNDERYCLFFDCVARKLGNDAPHAKDALMFDEVRRIGQLIYNGTSTKEMQNWALFALMFFSVFRRANVIGVKCKHVRDFRDGFVISLPNSKPDQYGNGHEVFIDPLPECPEVDPVRAIRRWKEQLGNCDGELPFFRHLGPYETITERPLSETTPGEIIKRMVEQIGLDPRRYSAQSLRAGLITAAILAGVSLPSLAGHTNHKELASLVRYFRPGAEHRMNIVRTIATAGSNGLLSRLGAA